MASKQYSCTLCQEDSQDVQAVSWCPECETFACLDCDRHHKKSKGTKHHATISVDAYRNLPETVKSASYMCTDHSQKQEFYCSKHACACCLQCVNENHSRCGEVKHLTDIVKNIKSSERVVDLEVNLDCLKKDFDVIVKHMHGRLNGAAADKSEGMSKIKTMRSEANKYMDIVEQTLVDKLNTEYESIRLETTNALEKVEESRINLTDTQTKLKSVVENATDLQVYNYLTNAEKINECELNNIRQLKSSKELEMVKIQVDISKGLSDFFQKMDNFGDVKIASSTSNLIFATSDTSASQSATKTSNTGPYLSAISDLHARCGVHVLKDSIVKSNDLLKKLQAESKWYYSMASVQHSCTLCKEDSLVVPAVSWCPECESFLCLDCDRHHTRSKTSKHHTTVSVDAYQNLPNDVKDVTNVCKDHAQSQEFYCPKHDCSCCLQCFNDNHAGCGEIKRLAEIVKNIKSCERVTILEFNLDFLKKDYDVILKHTRARLESVNVDELEGISKIKTMRSEVNRYMDIVEQTLIGKLKAECENIKTATMKLKEEVEESRNSIDGTQAKLKAVVGNATNLQIYNFLQSLEVKTEYELKKIEQLKKKREMVTTKIEVKISNALASFFNEIGNFGNVNVGLSNSNLTFVTGNKLAVQNATVSVSSAVDINDVHVTSFNTFSIPTIVCTNPDITGCAVLDNDIVLLDWNNKQMYRFTSNRSFLKVACSFPDHPSSICRVNEHTVAVTVPTAKTLSFINVTNGKTTYEKKMDGECYGVSCDGKEIVVSVINDKKTTVVIMDINGKHISAFDLDNENWICVYRWKDRIYLSNWSTNKIVCCKQYGDILWEYGNENLENPLDIAVVDRGIVLVACRKSNAIVVLSPNGKESKVLLSEKDGIHDPIALSVNNNNGRIFVTNGTNNSFSCFTVSTKKQVDG